MRAGWFHQSRSDLNRLQGNVGRRQASREALGQPGESHRQFIRGRALPAGVRQRRPGSKRRACLRYPHKGFQHVPWTPGEGLMAGLWFEEFTDGMVFNHEWSRTITETDNVWFSLLTMNVQPLHIDAHYAAKTEWGKPLVNSLFTLGLMIGMSVNDTTFGTTLANLGMTDVRFPKPLFQGDSVKVRTTVRSKRASKSRPNEGIVNFFHEMMNQDGVVVATCERAALMRKRPAETA